MKMMPLSRSVALGALLLAAACGAPAPNQASADGNGSDVALDEGNAALPAEMGGEAPVDVAALPSVPAGLSADEAAPLAQASEISSEIAGDAAVERVPFEGGWAWRRGGQTIRTASRDGRRVSYFRPGDAAPFFVQQGDESFAYAGGRVQRAYDRGGRPAQIVPARRARAEQLADQSRRDRDQAQRAPRGSDGPGRPGRDDDARPSGDRGDQAGRPGRDRDRGATSPAPGADEDRGNGRGARDRRRSDRDGDGPQGNRVQPRGI